LRQSSFNWFVTLLGNLKEAILDLWAGIVDEIRASLPSDLVGFIVGFVRLGLILIFSPLYLAMALLVVAPILVLIILYLPSVFGIFLLPIIALCSTQIIALITLATRSAPWGFGEHWLLQWLVEVTVTKWPAEEIGLTSVEDRPGIWALQHTALTKYPRFLDEMCRWIHECLANEPKVLAS
jgi:hypothetical protein